MLSSMWVGDSTGVGDVQMKCIKGTSSTMRRRSHLDPGLLRQISKAPFQPSHPWGIDPYLPVEQAMTAACATAVLPCKAFCTAVTHFGIECKWSSQ
jgi:hypothetical protein